VRIATRGSVLARWQAERVAQLLGDDAELVIVETTGDRSPLPIHAMGGTGVFVREVQTAVLDGRADIAVHSAKDLPSTTTPGLTIGAVPERADVRDALVGRALADIPEGGRVATGAVRRRVQLAHVRPDLQFFELRGNIGTRLDKAADFDAIVVAYAALDRLNRTDAAAEILDFVPQVGQGALAIECREDDAFTHERLARIDNPELHEALTTERAFLARVAEHDAADGARGCDLPCGAHRIGSELTMFLGTPDGAVTQRATITRVGSESATEFGSRAAAEFLTRWDATLASKGTS